MTKKFQVLFVAAIILLSLCGLAAQGQDKPKLDSDAKQAREYSLGILDEMEEILRENYYDPKFHGIDLKQRIEAAKARVKTMQYNWQMYRVLVQVLMDFDDSHTSMQLPPRSDHFDYGFRMQMIGDTCVIISVKKDSDAYKQGVRPGDQILQLGKFTPTRADLWKMIYVLYKLDPVSVMDLKIRKTNGTEQSLRVAAKTMTDKEFLAQLKARREALKDKEKYKPYKCQELSSDVIACKLYSFVVDKNDIDKMMTQALKYPKFILDLRGNGGGYVAIEQYVLSHFFDHEVKIADLITRKKTDTRTTKVLSADRQYKGELVVLVDSNSASAAEMTARVLQIENRAKIYGDYSSGSVMTSFYVPFRSVMSGLADAAIIRVGMNVTVADVIMKDGSRLEKRGVEPDEVLQPEGKAYAERSDPVLAYVSSKLGAALTPEKAGTFYFLMPKPDDTDAVDADTDAEDN